MTTIDSLYVEIEKLVLNTRRNACMAEARLWVQGLLDLCREHPDKIDKALIAEFINKRLDGDG